MADDVQSIAQAYLNALPAGTVVQPGSVEETSIARAIAVSLGTDLTNTVSVIRQISGATPPQTISPFETTTAPHAHQNLNPVSRGTQSTPADTVRVSPSHVGQEVNPVAAERSFWHTDHGKTIRHAAIGAVVVYVVTKIIDRVVS